MLKPSPYIAALGLLGLPNPVKKLFQKDMQVKLAISLFSPRSYAIKNFKKSYSPLVQCFSTGVPTQKCAFGILLSNIYCLLSYFT